MQDNNAYDNEYQNCFVTQGYGYNYEGAANVFTAQSNEQLKQISFKTLGAYDYTASVYALNADFDNPKDGRLLTAFSGKIENNGVHYIDVKDEVYLTSGEKFSVVIESNNDSSYMSFSSSLLTNQNCKESNSYIPVSYTHLRAHETGRNLVCRLLLEKKKKQKQNIELH